MLSAPAQTATVKALNFNVSKKNSPGETCFSNWVL